MPVEIERPKFLVDLLAEVDSFEAVYESHNPVGKDETPRGTLTPWLVRAFSLASYYNKQCQLQKIEREYKDNRAAMLDPEISEMKYKADVLAEILWASARAGLNLWIEPKIGVRAYFTVVRSEEKDDTDGFLKYLMARNNPK